MSLPQPVGTLLLEGLMSRAEILFTAGYAFRGPLHLAKIQASFEAIVSQISKLHHQLEFRAQNDFQWRPKSDYGSCFHVVESHDIRQELDEISARGFEIRAASGAFPFNLVVLKSTNPATPDEFILAQLCSHEFLDARSAESVFHLILEHYNALAQDNLSNAQQAIETARKLRTIDASAMMAKVKAADYDFEANAEHLSQYKVEDKGEHGVRLATIEGLLPEFRQRKRLPVSCELDAKPLIEQVRQNHPEVSKNSVITAVLHKAIYNINVQDKGLPKEQIISGNMVSDLISAELRQHYIGNYIGFVPVSTPGELAIEEIAIKVHQRIQEFKSKQINITCFEQVEQAAEQNLVGTADNELSYIITNWNNYRLLNGEELLYECDALAHYSAVNVDPIDLAGAALINRPVVVINLSPGDRLCFSMFPSLRDDGENRRIVNEVKRLFLQANS